MKRKTRLIFLLVAVAAAGWFLAVLRQPRKERPVVTPPETRAVIPISPEEATESPPRRATTRPEKRRRRGKDEVELPRDPVGRDKGPRPALRALESRDLAPLPSGLTTRLRFVSVNMKYPLVRIEETVAIDPVDRQEKVTRHVAMVADHILVQLRDGATEAELEALNRKYGANIRKKMRRQGLYIVEFPHPDLDTVPDNVAAYMEEADLVSFAEPDYMVHALQQRMPNDPRFDELWGMHNTGQTDGQADADIDAPEAWQTTVGNDVIVAVIDTGVDYDHEDLAANMWINSGEIPDNGLDDDGNGYIDDVHGIDTVNTDTDPKDDNDHGTHCAGTIAGVGDNGIGVVGVCWSARIMALKFLSAGGSGWTSDAIECIDYGVAMGAQVLNNSWGGGNYSVALYNAIENANQSNILFCAAAGNSGDNNDSDPHYPSSYTNDNVIAVAASTHMDELAYFSCYGATSVDLAAPGSEILSTLPDDRYASWGGTSMATPHVSGAAALLLSRNPMLNVNELREALMNSVDPVAAFSGKMVTGGRLNVFKALDLIYGISFDSRKYFSESWALITINDKSLIGTTNQTVSLSSSAGDSETLILTETEPGGYLFTNRIWIAYGAAVQSNGVMEGIHDTDLYATYFSPFAAGMVTGMANVHLGLEITITTPPGDVPYSTTNIQVTGINNGNVLVSMIVSNEATGEALPFSATNAWTAPAVSLATNQGVNLIYVSGSNVYGHADTDAVSIFRLSPAGTTNYVSKSGSHEWPYLSWATAATNIMAAVGAAANSNHVLVTNDTYYEEITVDRGITLRGANGPASTIIDGEYERRCATIEEDAVLESFTLTDGYEVSGGGAYMRGGELRDCIVSWNSAYDYGGGVYCERGGLINNCLITDNDAWDGGGIEFDHGGTVSNSTITWNYAWRYGGGVDCFGSGTVYNCTITDNYSDLYGGGVECWDGGVIHGSRIMYNYAWGDGGGVECFYGTATRINNSLISGNEADGYGGGVDCWGAGTLNNCTLTDNTATYGGGVYCYDGTLRNTIIYYNNATEGDNYYNDGSSDSYTYSCTTPSVTGEGNITDAPVLAGLANPHLLAGSPCIDSGTNAFATGSDIDGQARISGGTVDIGCDEWVAGGATGALQIAFSAQATNVAVNYSVELYADIQGVASQYVCDVADGTVYTNQPVSYHAWSATGTYQVVLTAYNTDNPGGISATVTVHVLDGTCYVSPSGGHIYPYASWTDAARNIQIAIDTVPYGGNVIVTDGVYNVNSFLKYGMENRIVIDKPVTVRSVNGPYFTRIIGRGPMGPNAIRCAYIGEDAVLDGFMLTNGCTRIGGSSIDERSGGGAFLDYGGMLTNCWVVGCSAAYRGGGVFCYNGGTVNNCLISGNHASSYGGGGVFCYFAGEVNNSEITSNNADTDAGGVYCYYGGFVQNSTIEQNSAGRYGGGLRLNSSAGLRNCLVQGNTAGNSGGGMYCYSYNLIENCTVAENTAALEGGGMYVRYSVTTRNTIIWSNAAPTGTNCSNTGSGWSYEHSCLDIDPGGIGNTTNPPVLRDGGRLDAASPCIDAGTNKAWMTGAVDLAGTSRIVNAVVDMGAYEFADSDGDGMPDYWETDNGLNPIVPDAGADPDYDGSTNLEEYQASTNPNDPDVDDPIAQITSPTNSSLVGTNTVIIGTASDQRLLNYTLDYGLGAAPGAWTEIVTASNNVQDGVLAVWDTAALAEALHTLRLRVRDRADKKTTNTVQVTVDTSAPTVSITSPTASSNYQTTATTVDLGGTAADGNGIANVAWTNDRGGSGICAGTTGWTASGVSLYLGDNIITVTAADNAGKITTDTLTIRFNRFPVLDPILDQTVLYSNLLTFGVSATDPDGTTPSLSAPGWGGMFTDHADGTGTFAWTPDQLADLGDHTVEFIASDGELSDTNEIEIHVSSFAVTNPVNGVGAYLGAGFDIEWAGLWPLDVVDIDLWQDTNLVATLTNNMPAPTSNMTWQASLPAGIEPASDYWVSVTDADYPTDYAMSEDFAVRNPRLLIQGRQRGMYGVWELNEDLSLNRWTRVGGPVPGWLARALDGNRILFQQGFGGAYGIWELNEDLSLNQWTQIGGSVPGWIARALDGNRILFQQGFGGAYGIWELNEDLSLNQWTQIGGSVPGWAARALDGNRILFQQGFGGAYGIWEYTAGWVPQTWTEISGAVPGWIARDLEGDKILFQAGYRGAYGIREHSAGWAPTTWTELRGAAPRGRVVGFDVE